jgi:hypothetical protein
MRTASLMGRSPGTSGREYVVASGKTAVAEDQEARDLAEEKSLAEEAQAILDGAPDPLPGLEAETRVTVLGTTFSTNEEFVLGEKVTLQVTGYVAFAGDQLIENEGKRHVVKIQSSLIQVVETGSDS